MITDEDIKKLATVFATKEDLNRFATKDDLLTIEHRMMCLEQKFEELHSSVTDLKSEMEKNTDDIIYEFVKYFEEIKKSREKADLNAKNIMNIEKRFQRIKLAIG